MFIGDIDEKPDQHLRMLMLLTKCQMDRMEKVREIRAVRESMTIAQTIIPSGIETLSKQAERNLKKALISYFSTRTAREHFITDGIKLILSGNIGGGIAELAWRYDISVSGCYVLLMLVHRWTEAVREESIGRENI